MELGARSDPSPGLVATRRRGGRDAARNLAELDRLAGPAAPVGLGRQLKDVAQARTVPSRATVRRYLRQQTRSRRVPFSNGSPGRLRVGRRDQEAAVVAGQVVDEEGVGAVAFHDAREPQLRCEPVLERAPETLDAALGLGAAGFRRADAELREGAPS